MADYRVQFEVFEGPLDLLLYLVKKEEVDIYQVNLTKIATEFLAYVELMRQLDLDVAGEFLVMASTLMYIKSRELLPVEQQVQTEEEDEGEDPRWELIRQLVEYKKFKDAAAQLQAREAHQELTYPHAPPQVDLEPPPAPRAPVSIFALIDAVNAVLRRFEKRDTPRDIFEDKWTVSEKITSLRQLLQERSQLKFSELFAETTNRTEVVVTFLALLELIRLRVLSVAQATPFSDIDIALAPPESPADPDANPAAVSPSVS